LSTIGTIIWRRGEELVVFRRKMSEALRRERGGLVSRILLHDGDPPETRLTVTWVEVAPGSGQRPHDHALEQVYVIVRGRMKVGDEEQVVGEGDLINIPPETTHGIENLADEVLTYVSAATQTIDWEAFYDEGPLRAR